MTSRSHLLLPAALLFCLLPAARAVAASDAAPKPSPTTTQAGPVFSLGGISIAPGPQCFAGPAVNAGVTTKPRAARPRRPANRSRRASEPVPLRPYARA